MVDSQLAAREHLVPGSTLRLLGIRGAMTNAPDLAHPVPLDVPGHGHRGLR